MKTGLLGIALFFLFFTLSFWRELSDILTLLLIGPIFLALYLGLEYILSKNVLKVTGTFGSLK